MSSLKPRSIFANRACRGRRAFNGAGRLVALALLVLPVVASAATILFVGNSFIYGEGSAVKRYQAATVTDLNGEGIGGVPALFGLFAREAGLDYQVSLETVPGVGLDHHYQRKLALIDRSWDEVVLSGYSTLDRDHPGDPALLADFTARLARLMHCRNPGVVVHLNATWSRADQTYLPAGHWYGQPISAMALDVRAGNDLAAARSPHVRDVIPVGEAWNRAFATGIADPNPYDGVAFGQLDLWAHDQYHASTAGYYLEALVIFGVVTHHDPATLGAQEQAAADLGLSADEALALQRVAHDELANQAPSPTAGHPPAVAEHCAAHERRGVSAVP